MIGLSTQEESPFGRLPLEMILEVLNYLPLKSRKKARLVCHKWRNLLDNDSKYFSFCPKLNNATFPSFLKSSLIMHRVTFQNVTKKIGRSEVNFPEIKKGILGRHNSRENILKFLYAMQRTERFCILKFSLGEISERAIRQYLKGLKWNNLAQLCITVTMSKYKFERVKQHLKNSALFLKMIKVPTVSHLSFEFIQTHECHPIADCDILFRDLCLALYEFLAHHSTTLRSLCISISSTRFRKYVIPEVPEKLKESITSNIKIVTLVLSFWGVQCLEALVFPGLFGSNVKTLHLICVPLQSKNAYQTQSNFLKLLVGRPEADSSILRSNLIQIFRANYKSLSDANIGNIPYFSLNSFEPCCSLTKVNVRRLRFFQIRDPLESEEIISPRIFEASAKTLISVSLNLQSLEANMAWFRNCCNLIVLTVKANSAVARTDENIYRNTIPPKMSLIQLNFELNSCNDAGSRQIQEFLDRCGHTLRNLDLGRTTGVENLSLRSCFQLVTLEIKNSPAGLLEGTTAANFQHLGLIDAEIDPEIPALAALLHRNMPNLTIVRVFIRLSFPILQECLQMPKIRFIQIAPDVAQAREQEIVEFLRQYPGTRSKWENIANKFCYLIIVNRDIHNNAQA